MDIRKVLNKGKEFLQRIFIYNRRTGEIHQGDEVPPNVSPEDLEVVGEEVIISFESSVKKLKRGKADKAILTWETVNADEILLYENGRLLLRCDRSGTLVVSPNSTSIYRLLAKSDSIESSQELEVSVYDIAQVVEFSVDKEYVLPTIPYTVKWEVKNALSVKFEGKVVNAVDSKKFIDGTDTEKEYTLSVTDHFETYTRKLSVKLLPLPFIESLIAPTPNLESNAQLSVEMPIKIVDSRWITVADPIPLMNSIEEMVTRFPNVENMPTIELPQFDLPQSRMEKLDGKMKNFTHTLASKIDSLKTSILDEIQRKL